MIPDHWSVERLKVGFDIQKRSPDGDKGTVTAFRDGQVTLRSNRRIDGYTEADKEIGYQGVEPNDLVIHAMDAFAGAIGVSDSSGKCSPVYSVCKARPGFHPQFYGLTLRSIALTGYITSLAKGVRERSTDFRWSDAKNLLVPIPPYNEQVEIVRFLDRETARIDMIIQKQERLIALLAEKRQAVISHAVTKGLDPEAPLKDSGVRWLGSIPTDWNVLPIKFVATLRSGDSITSDSIADAGEFPVFGGNGLRGYTTSYTHDGSFVLIGRQGALCGNINYAKGKFWASEHAIVVRPKKRMVTLWLGELLRTMNLGQYSMTAAQPGIAVEMVGNLRMPLPPMAVQQAISDFLSAEIAQIDTLAIKAQQSVELMKERRSALISAAVTGKIYVRKVT